MKTGADDELEPWEDPIPEDDIGSIYPVITKRIKAIYGGSIEILRPEQFKRRVGELGGPEPSVSRSETTANFVLIAVMVAVGSAFYYYSSRLSGPVMIAFVFALLIVGGMLLMLHGRRRAVNQFAYLQQLAGRIPGGFVGMDGEFPVIFIGRDYWNGWLLFAPAGEHQNEFCRFAARTSRFHPPVAVYKRGLIERFGMSKEENVVDMGTSEFGRTFVVSSTDPTFARSFLDANVLTSVARIAQQGRPTLNISRNYISIEVGRDLSKPSSQSELMRFIEAAEGIIGAVGR